MLVVMGVGSNAASDPGGLLTKVQFTPKMFPAGIVWRTCASKYNGCPNPTV
jgi:hypothetical protein